MKPSVPFTIDDVFQGLAETEGFLSVEGADLKLEFRTVDSLLGLLKSDVQEVRLPLDGIEEISYRKGVFGCSLVIRVSGMRGATDVPNFKEGEITLSIAKKHDQAAADFVSSVQLDPAAKKTCA